MQIVGMPPPDPLAKYILSDEQELPAGFWDAVDALKNVPDFCTAYQDENIRGLPESRITNITARPSHIAKWGEGDNVVNRLHALLQPLFETVVPAHEALKEWRSLGSVLEAAERLIRELEDLVEFLGKEGDASTNTALARAIATAKDAKTHPSQELPGFLTSLQDAVNSAEEEKHSMEERKTAELRALRETIPDAIPSALRVLHRNERGDFGPTDITADDLQLLQLIAKLQDEKGVSKLTRKEFQQLKSHEDLTAHVKKLEDALPGSVRLIARVRPRIPESSGNALVHSGSCLTARSNSNSTTACFNQVFDEASSTADVYGGFSDSVERFVADGTPALLLTLGRSGSGKTFTTMGTGDKQGLLQMVLGKLRGTDHTVYVNITEIASKPKKGQPDQNNIVGQNIVHSHPMKWRATERAFKEDIANNWCECTGWRSTTPRGAGTDFYLGDTLDAVERKRLEGQRIQSTLLNSEGSSRSHLFVSFRLSEAIGSPTLTVCDLAGLENPIDMAQDVGFRKVYALLRNHNISRIKEFIADNSGAITQVKGRKSIKQLMGNEQMGMEVHGTVRKRAFQLRKKQAQLILDRLGNKGTATYHTIRGGEIGDSRNGGPLAETINMAEVLGTMRDYFAPGPGERKDLPEDKPNYSPEANLVVNMLYDSFYVTQTFNEIRAFLLAARTGDVSPQALWSHLGDNRVVGAPGATYTTAVPVSDLRPLPAKGVQFRMDGKTFTINDASRASDDVVYSGGTMERGAVMQRRALMEKGRAVLRESPLGQRVKVRVNGTFFVAGEVRSVNDWVAQVEIKRSWSHYSTDANIKDKLTGPKSTRIIEKLQTLRNGTKKTAITVLVTLHNEASAAEETLQYINRLQGVLPSRATARGGAGGPTE